MNRDYKNFEVLRSEVLYCGTIFEVHKDNIQLPNGRISQIDFIDHRDAIIAVPVDQQGMVLFIKQYRHPLKNVLLELPAGVIEIGELPEFCAQREIREEIGMSAGNLDRIGGFYLAPGYSTEYMHVYLATDLSPDPLPGDEDEIISVVKQSAKESISLAETGQLQDAKSLVALFWARPYLIKLGLL